MRDERERGKEWLARTPFLPRGFGSERLDGDTDLCFPFSLFRCFYGGLTEYGGAIIQDQGELSERAREGERG